MLISSGVFQNTMGFHTSHPFTYQHYYWNICNKHYFYIQLHSVCSSHWITQSYTLFKGTHPHSPPLSSQDHCWYYALYSLLYCSCIHANDSAAWLHARLISFLAPSFLISNLYLPTDHTIILLCVIQSIFYYLSQYFLILGVNITVNETPGYKEKKNLQKNLVWFFL